MCCYVIGRVIFARKFEVYLGQDCELIITLINNNFDA